MVPLATGGAGMYTYFEQVPIDVVEAALERASAASAKKTPEKPPQPSLASAHKGVAANPKKAKNISRKGQQ